MSDETTGAPAPETPEPQPAATDAPAPAPAAETRRRGVEIPRWAAVALGAVVVFAGGFGIARATNDAHGGHERDRQSAVERGGDNRSNRNGDDTGRSGSSGSSQQGGAAPHSRTRGS